MRDTRRTRGREWKMALWAARHPGWVAAPTAVGAGLIELGPYATGGILAGATAAGVSWYRAHPNSFDRLAAPRLRAVRRRWLSRRYMGPWWSRIVEDCGLVTVDRRTGEVQVPRILRVRSYSPSTETVRVRLLLGQTIRQWQDAADHLAVALDAERVAVEKVSPRIIALVVQRGDSFEQTILPPNTPTDPDAVDLSSIYLGEDEFGHDWLAPIVGAHWLVSGTSGSGKNSVTWMAMQAVAPYVRDGLVRLHVVNPKSTEVAVLEKVAYRYAETSEDIAQLIPAFWETMETRKRQLKAAGLRTFKISRETPLDILLIDELGAVTGYGDRHLKAAVQQPLALTLSQARSLGGTVIGALQEPSKDVIPQRDLFTNRVCLRASSSVHVNMVLGDGMREKGALADEIPNVAESAGIGYVVKERTRTPLRVRAAYCDDDDIAEIVRVAGWPMSDITEPRITNREGVTVIEGETIDD